MRLDAIARFELAFSTRFNFAVYLHAAALDEILRFTTCGSNTIEFEELVESNRILFWDTLDFVAFRHVLCLFFPFSAPAQID